MSELILNWLNDEIQLSKRITSFEEDFNNGFLFGELLGKYNQQLNFSEFLNKYSYFLYQKGMIKNPNSETFNFSLILSLRLKSPSTRLLPMISSTKSLVLRRNYSMNSKWYLYTYEFRTFKKLFQLHRVVMRLLKWPKWLKLSVLWRK